MAEKLEKPEIAQIKDFFKPYTPPTKQEAELGLTEGTNLPVPPKLDYRARRAIPWRATGWVPNTKKDKVVQKTFDPMRYGPEEYQRANHQTYIKSKIWDSEIEGLKGLELIANEEVIKLRVKLADAEARRKKIIEQRLALEKDIPGAADERPPLEEEEVP